MNKTLAFSKRNLLEMARDPLSWIFCVAFPLVMLIIMTVVNTAIPKEAGMTIFRIDNLAGGIAIFGQMFVMLFTAIGLAKDRESSFLVRLYSSPMKSSDFLMGYLLPMIVTAVIQVTVSFIVALVIALITGYEISVSGLLLCIIMVIPSELMFSSIGLLFGTMFNEKAAPGICSILISVGSMLGGIWFDLEGVGGIMQNIAKCLPFYYATRIARSAIDLDFGMDTFIMPLIVMICCALAITVIAGVVFGHRMRSDLK
ncbi:MAG: ABC transporter permease [Saccharofermentans sp.]|nr:ABC transporter permease [Saccharofermentans sp.]